MAEYKNIKGASELYAFLQRFPTEMETKVMRGALREGNKIILAEAEANVPVRAGDLKATLRVSTSLKNGRVISRLIVGTKKVFYAMLVEFGTSSHLIAAGAGKALKIAGKLMGKVDHPGARPHPFLLPAFDSKAGAAIYAVAAHVRKALASKRFGMAEANDVDIGEAE